MTIMFIPKVVCAKCDRIAETRRKHVGNERYISARCHGQEVRVEFSREDGKVVRLWEELDRPPSSN